MNAAALAFALCCTAIPVQESDFDLFPLDETVRRQYADATHCRALLLEESAESRVDAGFWREWIEVSEHSCRAWKYLHLATTSEGWDREVCREDYQRFLQIEIGMEAYYAGRMPPTRPYAPRLFDARRN